jgi:hypothetical protein
MRKISKPLRTDWLLGSVSWIAHLQGEGLSRSALLQARHG